MSSTHSRSTYSPLSNPSSSSFQLAPAWLKGGSEPSPPPPPPPASSKLSNSTGPSNGHRAGSPSAMIQLGGSMRGGKLRNGPVTSGPVNHTDFNGHRSQQRPPSAGDFPSLDQGSRTRTAGQPASKKNWKEAALAVDLAAAGKDPVPAQDREREREKEREKEKLVNLVPKAPQPKKGGAHGKGAPPGKNPRERDNRVKAVHEPPPPKHHARSESPVSPGGGMVVLSLPKASRVESSSCPLRRSESAPPPEVASPVLLPAISAAGSSPSHPHLEAAPSPSVTNIITSTPTGQRDVRQISPAVGRTTSSLMQHFTSPPLDEAEEAEAPLAEEELRFMKELGWEDDGAEVAPLTTEEILQFKEFANLAPRTNKSLDEQRVLADRSLSEWAKRRAAP